MNITRRVGLSLFASGVACAAAPAFAQDKLRPITITASSTSLGVGATRVAAELGLFAKHGLSVRNVGMDSGNTALAAVISGSADAGFVGSGTVITAVARGQQLVSIVNGYGAFATTMVISKSVAAKLGVAPNAPVQTRLKASDGMLVGTPEPTAGSTLGFKSAMATVGAALRFTYMAQQAMPAALERGAIDGYLASAPYWAPPVANGTGIVWISGAKGELPPGTVNVSSTSLVMLRATAEKDPDLVSRLVAVFDDLHDAISNRYAEVRAATSRAYPDIDPKLLDIVLPDESSAWNAKPLTASDWASEIAFVKNSGTTIPGIETVTPEKLMLRCGDSSSC